MAANEALKGAKEYTKNNKDCKRLFAYINKRLKYL